MKRFAILLCCCLLLSSCAQRTAPSPGPEAQPPLQSSAPFNSPAPKAARPLSGVAAENYPRVDGSTANMPLMAEVYSRICLVSLEEAQTAVEVTTTGPAWRALAEGNTDLLMVYEAPENIRAELEEAGAELEISPLGRDGLIFLVNRDNPVDSLSSAQLRDIYAGKITDWGAVGGKPGPIAAFQRDAESGSQTLFLKLLMGDVPPMTPPQELVPGFMGGLIDGVAAYDGSGGAIGYSVYYYAREMYENPNLKLLSVDGVAPASETIGDKSYPLVNDFYVAIRAGEPEGSPARLLRDWLLGDGGREALEAAGYVAISR